MAAGRAHFSLESVAWLLIVVGLVAFAAGAAISHGASSALHSVAAGVSHATGSGAQ